MSQPLPLADLTLQSVTPILIGSVVVYVTFAGLFAAAGLIRPSVLRRALKVITFTVVAASVLVAWGVICVLSVQYAIGRIHSIFFAPITPINLLQRVEVISIATSLIALFGVALPAGVLFNYAKHLFIERIMEGAVEVFGVALVISGYLYTIEQVLGWLVFFRSAPLVTAIGVIVLNVGIGGAIYIAFRVFIKRVVTKSDTSDTVDTAGTLQSAVPTVRGRRDASAADASPADERAEE